MYLNDTNIKFCTIPMRKDVLYNVAEQTRDRSLLLIPYNPVQSVACYLEIRWAQPGLKYAANIPCIVVRTTTPQKVVSWVWH